MELTTNPSFFALESENGGDTSIAHRLQRSLPPIDAEVYRHTRAMQVTPFTNSDYAQIRAHTLAANRANCLRAIVITAVEGWSHGTLPGCLHGLKDKAACERLCGIAARAKEGPVWTWEAIQRTKAFIDIGIRTEADLETARAWIAAARAEHTHPEILKIREAIAARRERFGWK